MSPKASLRIEAKIELLDILEPGGVDTALELICHPCDQRYRGHAEAVCLVTSVVFQRCGATSSGAIDFAPCFDFRRHRGEGGENGPPSCHSASTPLLRGVPTERRRGTVQHVIFEIMFSLHQKFWN